MEYFVKWKNLDSKYNSWVPPKRIHPLILQHYKETQTLRKQQRIDAILRAELEKVPESKDGMIIYDCCTTCNSRLLLNTAASSSSGHLALSILEKDFDFVSEHRLMDANIAVDGKEWRECILECNQMQ